MLKSYPNFLLQKSKS